MEGEGKIGGILNSSLVWLGGIGEMENKTPGPHHFGVFVFSLNGGESA